MVKICIGANQFTLNQSNSNVVVTKEEREVLVIKDVKLEDVAAWEVAKFVARLATDREDALHVDGEHFT